MTDKRTPQNTTTNPPRESIKVRRSDLPTTPADAAPPAPATTEAAPQATTAQPAPDAAPPAPARRVFDPTAPQAPPPDTFAAAMNPTEAADQEDFAALFEREEVRNIRRFTPGESTQGLVVEIGTESVFIDIGAKTEGYLPLIELQDENGDLTVKIGDTIRCTVIALEKGGQILLGQKMQRGRASRDAIEMAFNSGIPVEGRVTALNKGGFDVEVMGERAFCPLSQIEVGRTETPEVHIEQTYDFRIVEFSDRGRKFVVSRAALQREVQQAKAADTRATLKVGAHLQGTVRSIQPYGVFVDLGGLDGFVHISEVTHGHVKHPSEVVSEGQTVLVEVMGIEQGPKGERISLSMKGTSLDPWKDAGQWLKMGEVYTGRVGRLAPFGAFVELQAGIEGLIHISELSWEKRIHHPGDVLSEGDQVEVAVVNLDFENKRVGLSLRATRENPWAGISARFASGEVYEGTVERVADFGVFVRLEQGFVGLIPMSELGLPPGQAPSAAFKVDDKVSAEVIGVDEERRRITLSRKSLLKAATPPADKAENKTDKATPPADPKSAKPTDGKRAGAPGPKVRTRGGAFKKEAENTGRDSGLPSSYKEAGSRFATFGDLLSKKLASQTEERNKR